MFDTVLPVSISKKCFILSQLLCFILLCNQIAAAASTSLRTAIFPTSSHRVVQSLALTMCMVKVGHAAATQRSTGVGITSVINELENKFTFYRTTAIVSPDEATTPSQPSDMDPLLRDIDLLSGILGDIVKRENPAVFDLYEMYRRHAVARSIGDTTALSRMIICATQISAADSLGVVRAFTQMLNLVNAAEVHHRARSLRLLDKQSGRCSPLPVVDDSVAGTFEHLLRDVQEGQALQQRQEEIFGRLMRQQVDIVLTAHPTEVNRRTLLRKYRKITELLAVLDGSDLTGYERQNNIRSLRREVASIWGSDEIRRQRPTPQQEARGGIAILESVLWDAVPSYLRKLSLQCEASLGRPLPMDHVPVRFSSWMGGDRDGNPNVTPSVTLEVATTQRLQVAKLYLNDVVALYKELAVCKGFSAELQFLAISVKRSFDRLELYRRVLGHVRKRLMATVRWCEAKLSELRAEVPGALHVGASGEYEYDKPQRSPEIRLEELVGISESRRGQLVSLLGEETDAFFDTDGLLELLSIIHSSLVGGGYSDVADGQLADLIRRVATFGLTFVPLDLRQESTRHTLALDAITNYLGVGSYSSWSESARIEWLVKELDSKRPFFHNSNLDSLGFDAQVLDTLRTIETASGLGPGALGAYVISQSKAASDVLAVMVLQQQFGMTPDSSPQRMMRVVPLFETLTDLRNAPDIVATLFALPHYIDRYIDHKQEIMVGYSDSAKDAGRLAACWEQYVSQERMGAIAQRAGVKLTFFHGKGGTVGRGGNPALYRAVLAHPPNTINGRFRVTEQGEMITQNFGSTDIAERTLDIYTAAVLAEGFVTHVQPTVQWRAAMDKLAESSCSTYRALLGDPSFVTYFKTATPELELSRLNIGSRPTKRNPSGGIESLRAIPWTFAWTQTRLHLPAWLGVGEALQGGEEGSSQVSLEELQEMYAQWPFFKEMVDLIAMTLSKTDYSVSANYELQLVEQAWSSTPIEECVVISSTSDSTSPSSTDASSCVFDPLGDRIRDQLVETRRRVLQVSGCGDLSGGFELLQQSMRVRYPLVDPLNVLQAEVVKRLRRGGGGGGLWEEADRKLLEDALTVSINGIAQGMKNSG